MNPETSPAMLLYYAGIGVFSFSVIGIILILISRRPLKAQRLLKFLVVVFNLNALCVGLLFLGVGMVLVGGGFIFLPLLMLPFLLTPFLIFSHSRTSKVVIIALNALWFLFTAFPVVVPLLAHTPLDVDLRSFVFLFVSALNILAILALGFLGTKEGPTEKIYLFILVVVFALFEWSVFWWASHMAFGLMSLEDDAYLEECVRNETCVVIEE